MRPVPAGGTELMKRMVQKNVEVPQVEMIGQVPLQERMHVPCEKVRKNVEVTQVEMVGQVPLQ